MYTRLTRKEVKEGKFDYNDAIDDTLKALQDNK